MPGRRLTRSSDEPPAVTVHFATVADVKTRLSGVQSGEVVDRKLNGLLTNELAGALFSNRVFLVEGSTDSAVFYGVGDRSGQGRLEAMGLSIVSVGSKTMIPLAHAILKAIGIPVYALFDADAGFEIRATANGKAADKIESERRSHIAANRMLLRYFGRDEVDFPAATVGEDMAIFEDQIEVFLSGNWPEWSVSYSNVEAEAGINFAKNQLAYRMATAKAEGAVPEVLSQILIKAVGQ